MEIFGKSESILNDNNQDEVLCILLEEDQLKMGQNYFAPASYEWNTYCKTNWQMNWKIMTLQTFKKQFFSKNKQITIISLFLVIRFLSSSKRKFSRISNLICNNIYLISSVYCICFKMSIALNRTKWPGKSTEKLNSVIWKCLHLPAPFL